jgi:hypothetical protein
VGDYWYQTDTRLTKRYDGTDWQNVGTSPFDEGTDTGVAFETENQKVQILNDGTINAVDGKFSGRIEANEGYFNGVGNFAGNITNDLFNVVKSTPGISQAFDTPTKWNVGGNPYNMTNTDNDGYQYATMWNTWTFIARQPLEAVPIGDYFTPWTTVNWSLATSVTGTHGGKNVIKMARCYDNNSRSGRTGIAILYSDDSKYWLEVSDLHADTEEDITLTAPSAYDTDDLIVLSNTASFLTGVSGLEVGTELPASGTVTHNGTARTITSIVPPSALKYSGGQITVSGYMNISGTVVVDTNPDTVEFLVSPTPGVADIDIGQTLDKFRDGYFSGTVNATTVSATDVITTNGPNKPVDNNDSSLPAIGIGGFTYGVLPARTGNASESFTLPAGGTYVYVISESSSPTDTSTRMGRGAGGSTTLEIFGGTGSITSIIAWRIA